MKQTYWIGAFFILVFTVGNVGANTIFEYPLDNPPQYTREIGPIVATEHSAVDIYVQNMLNPLRWKDWIFKIWIPDGASLYDQQGGHLNTIVVDYDNTPGHTGPLLLLSVPVVPIVDTRFADLGLTQCFYANTFDTQWEQFGTSPVGSGGPNPIGNPGWVSFHFYLDIPLYDPFAHYVFDKCIPEPATICLLGLGVLGLLRKRSKA